MSLKSFRCLSFVFLLSFFNPHVAIGSTTPSEHGKKALELYTHYSAEASQLADEERRKKLQAIIAEGEKGVAKNDRLAMALIGVFLQDDLRIGDEIISAMNRDRSFALLKKSYDMGEIEAAHGLVKAYANGWGVQRDRTLAKTLVQEAINKGCTDCEPLRRDLERGSGPLLEFYPEQAAGCSMPTDKKRKYEVVAVPCSNGTFSGYGSITYTEGNSQRKCVLTGDFSNGVLEGQGTSVCGNYTYRGGFAKGKRSGAGQLDGPDGYHAEGRYLNDRLDNGFVHTKNESGIAVGNFYINGSHAGVCTRDQNPRVEVNCNANNRNLIFQSASASGPASTVQSASNQGSTTGGASQARAAYDGSPIAGRVAGFDILGVKLNMPYLDAVNLVRSKGYFCSSKATAMDFEGRVQDGINKRFPSKTHYIPLQSVGYKCIKAEEGEVELTHIATPSGMRLFKMVLRFDRKTADQSAVYQRVIAKYGKSDHGEFMGTVWCDDYSLYCNGPSLHFFDGPTLSLSFPNSYRSDIDRLVAAEIERRAPKNRGTDF